VTLRARLGFGFFATLVGPALLATGLLAGALPAPAPGREEATQGLRLVLAARCESLATTAKATAVRAASEGASLVVTPAGAVDLWAPCETSGLTVTLPPGTRYSGLAARADVRRADGTLTGYAYAVQPLDDAFLADLSGAAGVRVRAVPVGAPALPDLPVPLALDPVPAAGAMTAPVMVTALSAGVLGAAMLAWWLAGLATRPLRTLLAAVDRVAAGDLTARAQLAGRDETGRLGRRIDELIVQMQQTQRLSVTDELTGLGNVRALAESVRREIERAGRFGRALGVLVLDLDHFKEVNDHYGHRAGDTVLTECARRIRGVIREVDLAFRQGGEEFVVLLPETDVAGSLTVARRVGEAIRSVPFTIAARPAAVDLGPSPHDVGPERIGVTVSIGVAVFPRHANSGVAVLDAADEALYAAKAAGRDTYALSGGLVPEQRTGPVPIRDRSPADASNGTTSPRTSAAG
jgi:diguanylate cyclase (GGDEF)-like protein